VHVKRRHHLISRLVVEKSLILHPVVNLKIAMVRIKLNEKWRSRFTLMLQLMSYEKLATVPGEDSLVVLLTLFSLG
jgi:hypothetical protein